MLTIRTFLTASLLLLAVPLASASSLDGINTVATVNGAEITRTELNGEVGRLLPTTFFHQTVDDAKRQQLQETALASLIEKKLKIQEALRLELKIPEEVIDKELEAVMAKYPSKKDFEQRLKAANFTMADARQAIERNKLAAMVYEHEVVDKVILSDKNLQEYYENNMAQFREPFKFELTNIFFRVPPLADEKEREDIKKHAESVVTEIAGGLDFIEAVQKYSEGADKEKDGRMGLLHKGRLAPEIEEKIAVLKPGEVAGPFRAFKGFYIFRLEANHPERQLDFNEIKDKLRGSLTTKRIEERKKAWLDELKAKADIQYPEPQ